MKPPRLTVLSAATVLGVTALAPAAAEGRHPGQDGPAELALTLLGRYETGAFDEGAAEITAHDPDTQRVFTVNAERGTVDVLDISRPAEPREVAELTTPGANSVAVSGGLVAVAQEAADKTAPGTVSVFRATNGRLLETVTVGALPDALAFTPDGRRIVVVNEGEPSSYCADAPEGADPEGAVSVITLDRGRGDGTLDGARVRTADFRAWNGREDELRALGGRSLSVLDSRGTVVWDSGDDLERLIAERHPDDFNTDNSENAPDSRSDNKGPEPEGVTVGTVDGTTYAFAGLERVGGVVVHDLTDPREPRLAGYVNSRDFAGDPETGTAGDLGPEGLTFIPAADSPNGEPLLVVGNEVSGSTAIYRIG
ncbi:choice-of-anchor I domain-containing protein [Streptomyces litchfieldiae]|uniref:Choice-of-anchor I domain-containing protein n=1 Tax=Streptomyces litchfieldiae TaxID=3075543 RepID=A0ABU2N038_9ACTN|nr:hypothetical protein [Streptomyces sp. DSM 44938]MDT0347155.1 hypothetical protein [Streptomyces sp. DSM 44938]